MKFVTRRDFFSIAAAAGLLGSTASLSQKKEVKPQRKVKLGISTYSYWHFRSKRVPIEKVIDQASALGVEGVDILHRQMESEEPAYLRKLKRHALVNGVALICLSIHQGTPYGHRP